MQQHLIQPGQRIDLDQISTHAKDWHSDRDAAENEFKKLRKRIATLQPQLYAEHKQQLLIVFQAMDGGGKDGTTRAVFEGVNPQGVHVISFKQPSLRELEHDFLWRIHRDVPRKGMIHVFNRSHYEDVIVVRVENLVPETVWRQRYNQINEFETLLTQTGTRIVKFYLHISKDEQKARFQDRLDDPKKNWKFSRGDLEKRKQWDEYRAAYEDAISNCSTHDAPWYVIPADQNWYRNWAVSKIIVATLEEMDPKYPEPEAGLDQITIE